MFNKKTIIIAAIAVIIVVILTKFTSLELNNSKEIEVEIRNGIINYDKPYILKGSQKDKLIDILNHTKLGPYLKKAEIPRNSTILIRLYGKGVKNSSFPVYIYYFVYKPNDSIGQINNKLYSVDKKIISQLHDFFKIPD